MNYDLLLRLMNEHGFSRRKLALQAGIPPTTLNSAINSKTKHFPHEYIVKLAQVLGVRWFDLYDATENEDWISYMTMNDWTLAANVDDDDLEFMQRFSPMQTQFTDSLNAVEQAIMQALKQLTPEGQYKALERVEELGMIPKYRKDVKENEEST